MIRWSVWPLRRGIRQDSTVVRTRTQSEQSSGYSLSQLAAQREAKTTGWRCKKCGKMNTTTALYCVDCGGER